MQETGSNLQELREKLQDEMESERTHRAAEQAAELAQFTESIKNQLLRKKKALDHVSENQVKTFEMSDETE